MKSFKQILREAINPYGSDEGYNDTCAIAISPRKEVFYLSAYHQHEGLLEKYFDDLEGDELLNKSYETGWIRIRVSHHKKCMIFIDISRFNKKNLETLWDFFMDMDDLNSRLTHFDSEDGGPNEYSPNIKKCENIYITENYNDKIITIKTNFKDIINLKLENQEYRLNNVTANIKPQELLDNYTFEERKKETSKFKMKRNFIYMFDKHNNLLNKCLRFDGFDLSYGRGSRDPSKFTKTYLNKNLYEYWFGEAYEGKNAEKAEYAILNDIKFENLDELRDYLQNDFDIKDLN